jgi:tetratricopeptide (TPR) repeat protein
MNLFDKIEAYLFNELSPTERQAFEKEIANDETLAKKVDLHRLEHLAMGRMVENNLRQKMYAWEEEYQAHEINKNKLNAFKFSWKIGIGIIGIVAFLASIIYYSLYKKSTKTDTTPTQKADTTIQSISPIAQAPPPASTQKTEDRKQNDILRQSKENNRDEIYYMTYAENLYKEPSLSTLRGSNPNTLLLEANDAFIDKDYQKVVAILKDIEPLDPQYAETKVILAHSYFKLKQYEKAQLIFKELIKTGNPYTEDAEWFLLLCYLTNFSKNKKNIDINLQNILKDSLHKHYNQAQELRKIY